MNREIKFRAWDKKRSIMYLEAYPCRPAFNGCTWNCYHSDGGNIFKDDDEIILIQYTGLKDKKGKEIFEDDIVIIHGGNPELAHRIFWNDGSAAFNGKLGFKFIGDGIIIMNNELSYEIIGNFYENSELLKKPELLMVSTSTE